MNHHRDGYITSKSAADYLGISESKLAKLRLTGGGPRYTKMGRTVRYSKAELDIWADENSRSSTSDLGRGAAVQG